MSERPRRPKERAAAAVHDDLPTEVIATGIRTGGLASFIRPVVQAVVPDDGEDDNPSVLSVGAPLTSGRLANLRASHLSAARYNKWLSLIHI